MTSPTELVTEFHQTYDCAIRNTPTLDVPEKALRLELIREEFEEFREALENNDIIEVADALADLTYVIYGAALTFGIPLDEVLAEVHASNMSKLGADGKPIYRESDRKVLKGENFFTPDIARIMANAQAR